MVTRKPRVLVTYKKSAYQLHMLERRDPHLWRFLRASPGDAADMREAHAVHQQTLDMVVQTLKRLGVRCDVVYRAQLRTTAGYDVVVSVGGDGTFLQASHAVEDIPLLGVNSDPRRSEAVFCAATGSTFDRVIRRALAGTLKELQLSRLQLWRNGRRLRPLALNDVLIAHEDPATMSRYRLTIGARQEDQKSSGLWVATAAGSSSAILAAGGTRLAWTARQFQYWPRELYRGRLNRYRFTGGVLPPSATVSLTWLMRTGAVFLDGPHVRVPLRFGDRLLIERVPNHPLRVLGLSR